MSRHNAEEVFARTGLTPRNSTIWMVTGPVPWMRRTREDTGDSVVHMLLDRPPGGYEGWHRRPRANDMPDGMIYWSDPSDRWMIALDHYRDIALDDRP